MWTAPAHHEIGETGSTMEPIAVMTAGSDRSTAMVWVFPVSGQVGEDPPGRCDVDALGRC